MSYDRCKLFNDIPMRKRYLISEIVRYKLVLVEYLLLGLRFKQYKNCYGRIWNFSNHFIVAKDAM